MNIQNFFKSILFYMIVMTPKRRLHLPKSVLPITKKTITLKAGKRILEPDIYHPKNKKNLPALIIYCPLAREGKDDINIVNFLNGVARLGYFAIVPVWTKREAGQIEPDDDIELSATTEYLINHPQVDPKRISILGISYGGSVALNFASNPKYAPHIKNLSLIGSSLDLKTIFDFVITRKIKNKQATPSPYLKYIVIKTICQHFNQNDKIISLRFLQKIDPAKNFQVNKLNGKITNKNYQLLKEICSSKPNPTIINQSLPKSLWQFVEKFNATKNIEKIQQKILIFHSTEDTMVPATESEQIHNLAKNSKLYLVDAFDHTVPKQATLKNITTTYLPSFATVSRFIKDMLDETS